MLFNTDTSKVCPKIMSHLDQGNARQQNISTDVLPPFTTIKFMQFKAISTPNAESFLCISRKNKQVTLKNKIPKGAVEIYKVCN